MNKPSIKRCLFFMALLLAFAACQKDDGNNKPQAQQALQVQKFLTLPPNADNDLVRIAAELTKQNDDRNFIPRFIKNYGYAAWEHALHNEKNGTVNKYLPLVNNNEKTVGAIIQCIIKQDKINFRLLTPYNLKFIIAQLPNQIDKPDELTFKALFWDFGNRIFGHPLTWIVDIDKNGEIMREYPATDGLQEVQTKAKVWNCITVGVAVGGMYDEQGNYIGGGTDIIWERRCRWIDEKVEEDASPEDTAPWDDFDFGGGGGPPPKPKPEPDKPENPCDQLNNFLGTDTDFKNSMKSLANTVNTTNQELAWQMRKESYGDGYIYTIRPGIQGECEIPYYPSQAIDGFIHSHNSGCLPIFSTSDLVAMYSWYKNGYIEDIDNFVFGVITNNGAYMLKVEDINAFEKFGENALVDPGGRNSLEYMYFEFHKISNDNSSGSNELSFLRILNSTNSGLKLYKSNSTDYSNWDKLSIIDNSIFNENCN